MSGKMNIAFLPLDITDAEVEAVAEILRFRWIITEPRAKKLEKQIAEYAGTSKLSALIPQQQ